MVSNGMNPMQLIGLMMRSGNPQQFLMNMLSQIGGGNPMIANLLNLAQHNDTAGIEQIARNICNERGVNFDKEFADFKKQIGL